MSKSQIKRLETQLADEPREMLLSLIVRLEKQRDQALSRLRAIDQRIRDLGYYDLDGFIATFEMNVRRLERVIAHCQCSPFCHEVDRVGEGRVPKAPPESRFADYTGPEPMTMGERRARNREGREPIYTGVDLAQPGSDRTAYKCVVCGKVFDEPD